MNYLHHCLARHLILLRTNPANIVQIDMLDKFKGCILGLAMGDALGMPVEGFTAQEIEKKVGTVRDMMPAPECHYHYGLQAGQFTDDTQSTLLLAEAMIEAFGFSGDKFAEKLKDWGASWTLDSNLNRGVGITTKSSIDNMIAGMCWRDSGLSIPTCGSAMRVAPIGLVYHCDLNIVANYADLQSTLTHCNPAARAGAIAVAVGVALSLKNFPRNLVLQMAYNFASKVDLDFANSLLYIRSLTGLKPAKAIEIIGNSPIVSETVPAAFYCFVNFEPEEALMIAASGGGDTDSIASIAGALLGAERGTSWMPHRWLVSLEDRKRLENVAEKLAELSYHLCKN
jgi:ADP-ribosyl-[dinitrogen reductase] hydrolase